MDLLMDLSGNSGFRTGLIKFDIFILGVKQYV